MRLVLLGLPGAGKGTQGDQIAEKYGIPHISTGSIIRQAVASGIGLGQEANTYISKGDLIPDELAIQIVYERISEADCTKGWILDGFPRTVLQARALDERLAQDGLNVQMAFDIRITQEEAIQRIAKRRMCRQCGAVYHLEYYRARDKGVCDSCGGQLYRRDDDTEETAPGDDGRGHVGRDKTAVRPHHLHHRSSDIRPAGPRGHGTCVGGGRGREEAFVPHRQGRPGRRERADHHGGRWLGGGRTRLHTVR